MRNLNDIFNLGYSDKCSWHMDIAVESIKDGNDGCAYNHLVELLFDEFGRICDDIRRDSYFRFTSIPSFGRVEIKDNPVINDVLNDRLTFSNPRNFNDPMDPIVKVWLENSRRFAADTIEKKLFKMLKNVLDKHLRIACLASSDSVRNAAVEAYRNPLMWAHYANSHKGICVQYELSDEIVRSHNDENHILRMADIRYRDHKMLKGSITIDNAMLAKADCWEYEHESRLMYYVKDNNAWKDSGKVSDYVSIPGFPVKAVYMGYRIDNKVEAFLKRKLSAKNIPLYKMSFMDEDLTRMVANKIV